MLEDFTRNVGASSKFISGSLGREHLFKYLPASQTELPIRRMSVSHVVVNYFIIYIFCTTTFTICVPFFTINVGQF